MRSIRAFTTCMTQVAPCKIRLPHLDSPPPTATRSINRSICTVYTRIFPQGSSGSTLSKATFLRLPESVNKQTNKQTRGNKEHILVLLFSLPCSLLCAALYSLLFFGCSLRVLWVRSHPTAPNRAGPHGRCIIEFKINQVLGSLFPKNFCIS